MRGEKSLSSQFRIKVNNIQWVLVMNSFLEDIFCFAIHCFKTVLFFALTVLLASCMESGDDTILVNDPQNIISITEYMPKDLRDYFGEENVNFGDHPPKIDYSFSSKHKYVSTNLTTPNAPQPGQISPVIRYHKFHNQYLAIADYVARTSEQMPSNHYDSVSPVYIIGHDSLFTAYYQEESHAAGRPTWAVIISGKITDSGISNYRYGYQIMRYAESPVPENVYPVNSIFVFEDENGLAEYNNW